MDDAVAQNQVAPSTRPKKPFLRRGEGTTRRVYASRYRDEAKKKREEMQQKARELEEVRERKRDGNDDRFVDLTDPQSATFLSKDPAGDASLPETVPFAPDMTLRSNPGAEEEASSLRQFGDLPFSVDASNAHDEDAVVDGSCLVESAETCPEVTGTDTAGMSVEAKHVRESEWLECQRRHEDEQWIEAMELREFAALEKQIAEETRDKLARAEASLKQKRVTFQEPHAHGPAGITFTPRLSKGGVSEISEGGVDGGVKKNENVEPKASPLSNQKGFQKLKKISATRIARSQSVEAALPSKTCSRRRQVSEQTETVQKTARPKADRSLNMTRNGKGKDQNASAEEEFVVDSSFLDRLVEQDFQEESTFCPETDSKQKDNLFAERLRLQSLKEELENERCEWQQKHSRAMAEFEAMKTEELKKIKRERRVLEQQSKALLKLPNKKERSEIESLEALLETERKETRSKEARYRLTVERLKDQMQQLQVKNKELQQEVKWYEEMHLNGGHKEAQQSKSVGTCPPLMIEIGTQMDRAQQEGPLDERHPSLKTCNDELVRQQSTSGKDSWAVQLENPFYLESSAPEPQMRQDPSPSFLHYSDVGREAFDPSFHQTQPAQLRYSTHGASIPSTLPETQQPYFGFHRGDPQAAGQWLSCCGIPSDRFGCMTNPLSYSNAAFDQTAALVGFPSANHQPIVYGCSSGSTLRPLSHYPCTMNRSTPTLMTNERIHDAVYGADGAANPMLGPGGHWPAPSASENQYFARDPVCSNSCVPSTSLQNASNNVSNVPHAEAAVTHRVETSSVGEGRDLNVHGTRASQSCIPKLDAPLLPESTPLSNKNTKRHSAKSFQTDTTGHHVQKEASLRRRSITSKEKGKEAYSTRRDAHEHNTAPRVSTFENGTIKQTYPDGRVVVWFANADVKHVHPCGRVEYFYADLNTWQVTHNTNVDTFYFDIGQVEAHKPNGDKDIIFPDGTVRTVLADGTEREATMDDVTAELRFPKPDIPGNRPQRTNYAKRSPKH